MLSTRLPHNNCCLCGGPCDGTLMRHNSLKVREMIAGPDVPYRKDGGPALCHGCQRSVYFKGGILPFLAKEVSRRARYRSIRATGRDELGPPPPSTDDEDAARQRFIDWRWPDGVTCPICDTPGPYLMTERKVFRCSNVECRYQFSATAGTVFAGRKLPYALMLKILNSTADNPSQLSREMGITYKTAWAISKRKMSEWQR